MNYNPTDEEVDFICQSLMKFNNEIAGPDHHELLKIVEYDDDGKAIAGIFGGTYWGWMHIDILFVDEKHRHTGIG